MNPARLLRQLQTSSTDFTINYYILSDTLNATTIDKLITDGSLMTIIGQGLTASPSSSTIAANGSNNLIMAVAIPLGVLAAVSVAAIVIQVNRRKQNPIRSPKTIVYVTETPLSASREVRIHDMNEERISHNPTRIRI